MILKSLSIPCEPVDIAGPGMDKEKEYMREKGKRKDGQRNVLPPQLFNEDDYRGVRRYQIFRGPTSIGRLALFGSSHGDTSFKTIFNQ